ncbi:DUF983 domain-containing protein [Pedobacter sp. SYSU D00535]|uniref:DUF983 domain-containing protein n=1 Tax=Pedobacter sp. SYSU D00535 TaxID=2810308 RepID=UPI001A964BDB|nr:DUF983 domain-containing protein [Pedobacter sp. SYSU D00535]
MDTLKIDKEALKNSNKDNPVPSQFAAALQAKCPRCRRGDMFEGSMYGFKLQKMHVHCPHCHLKFEREPGYFYVAMFVSYAMNVAQMIILAVAIYLITNNLEDPVLYLAVIFPAVFILSPFNYRFSRVILLYWLTPGLHYDREMSKDNPNRLSN